MKPAVGSRYARGSLGRLAIDVSAIAIAVAVPAFVVGQRGLEDGEWRAYAGDSHGQKYSPLNQITKENIQDLRVVWRSPLSDREAGRANPVLATVRNESTPLVVNGVLYHVSGLGQVSAIDPGTGQMDFTPELRRQARERLPVRAWSAVHAADRERASGAGSAATTSR